MSHKSVELVNGCALAIQAEELLDFSIAIIKTV
jgi:hypothetical protein